MWFYKNKTIKPNFIKLKRKYTKTIKITIRKKQVFQNCIRQSLFVISPRGTTRGMKIRRGGRRGVADLLPRIAWVIKWARCDEYPLPERPERTNYQDWCADNTHYQKGQNGQTTRTGVLLVPTCRYVQAALHILSAIPRLAGPSQTMSRSCALLLYVSTRGY